MFFRSQYPAILFTVLSVVTCVSTSISTETCGNCTCQPDPEYNGTLVKCSGINLFSVPRHLPLATTTLLLDKNKIVHIPNKAFQHVPHLKILNMSNNGPITFEDDAFFGLLELESLMLNYKFHGSNMSRDYPDRSLSKLTSLKALYINGLPNDFGHGFAKLTNLNNLSLSSGDCNIGRLRNSTFTNIPYTQNLVLSNCKIDDTELLTFNPLKNIHSIDISLNRNLGLRNFSKAVYGLQNSPIRILKINNIYEEYGPCSQILLNDLFYLHNTNLTHLHIDGNGITRSAPGVVTNLPDSLEYLSARENRFAYGIYIFEMIRMPSLKFLDFSLMNTWHELPFHDKTQNDTSFEYIPVPLPPKLEIIVAEKCYIKGAIGKSTMAKNNLRKVIGNHNLLSNITGPTVGLEAMEHWDLSHNQLQAFDSEFFPLNNSVTYLNLAYNFLGKELEIDDGSLFGRLCHAEIIDISFNMIDSLPYNTFQGLKAAESLNVNGNFLESFDVKLRHLSQLKTLDLSNNKLQRLPMKALTEIGHLNNVEVDLRDNPLLCYCQELYFMKWMKENKHRFRDLSQTTCELPNRTIVDLDNLDDILYFLQQHCEDSPGLTLSVIIASCCVFIVGIVSVALTYRHRWKIRYFYHIARRRYWRSNPERACQEQFEYDVFVSYAETDRNIVIQEMIQEIEGKAGLKMCIHHRDFLPGEVISTNIVNAIDRSKKTLIVLSPTFLQSDWCLYEFQIALQTRVSRRQNNLLILLYEHVPVRDLPGDLAVFLSTNCYLEYNPDVYGREAFWENLVEAIKSVQPLE